MHDWCCTIDDVPNAASFSPLRRMSNITPQRVCFFNTLRFWGGGEKFYFQYGLGLKQRGHHVIMVCDKEGAISKKASEHDIEQVHLRVNSRSVLNPAKVRKLIKFFKKQQIDAVIFSTSQDLKIGALSAKRAGVPVICFRRGLAVPVKNRATNRLIYTKYLTHILANSEETKRTILKHLSEYIPADKIKVIYNGIPLEEMTQGQSKLSIIENHGRGIIIGNAGRLTIQKGQDRFIEIARDLKASGIEFTIFIAGTGELHESLLAEIKEHDLQDHIYLLGFVEDIPGFMRSLDIFALTSAWEGFGYVLAEAMIQAKPVVAFEITSNPELVIDNKTGFLVDFPDTMAFSEKLALLAKDAELRSSLGQAGKQRVIEHFNIEDRINEFEQYLLG